MKLVFLHVLLRDFPSNVLLLKVVSYSAEQKQENEHKLTFSQSDKCYISETDAKVSTC